MCQEYMYSILHVLKIRNYLAQNDVVSLISQLRLAYLYYLLTMSRVLLNKIFWVKGRRRSCRFLRIFTYTDQELFQVRLGLKSVPQGQKISPAGLEPPAESRKRRKSNCENTKKPATSFSSLDPNFLYLFDFGINLIYFVILYLFLFLLYCVFGGVV